MTDKRYFAWLIFFIFIAECAVLFYITVVME